MSRRLAAPLLASALLTTLFFTLAALAQPSEPTPGAVAASPTELGTSFRPPSGALIAPGKAPDLTILHTGDVVGYVDTCGCPHNPAGGLPRRTWVLEQLRKNYPATPQLILDAGNFTDNPTPAGDIRTEALMDAMGRVGYAVVNVAERELMLGYDEFVRRMQTAKFATVSTNIVRQDTKETVFRPFVIVEVPRGEGKPPLRVGVLGIVRFNPLFLKAGPQKSNLIIAQPREALKRVLPEVRRRSDLVVLLANLHDDDARLLARDVAGIDFVLGAYGGASSSKEEDENGARIVYVGNQGKYLSENRVFMDAGTNKKSATVTYLHFLTARYPDDEPMQQFVGETMGKINGQKVSERQKSEEVKVAAADRPYAGPVACKACHTNEYDQWAETPHARAFVTLKENKQEARCVPCHVTGGAAEVGGFEDSETTPELEGVTCESCHGPGTAHVLQPKRGYGKIELSSCIACHNRANSPNFDYYGYLPRVVHTQPPPR